MPGEAEVGLAYAEAEADAAQAAAETDAQSESEPEDGGTLGPEARRFPFEVAPRLGVLATAFGVTPSRAYVEVTGSELVVRFGFWSLRTPLANVRDARMTGPYQWWKVAGPARLSLADQGVTFATTTTSGVCIRFHRPVPAALPVPWLRHPSLTVTVAAPHALIDTLAPRTHPRHLSERRPS
jgi:hypothetical protein